jgi:uncharacterized protein (TIGR02145 family)
VGGGQSKVSIMDVMRILFCAFALILALAGMGSSPIVMTNSGREQPEGKAESVPDIDGNVYRTVRIGGQVWMAENLRVTRYRDGSPIPFVQDEKEWGLLRKGAYCLSGDDPSGYQKTYGGLYNYYAVVDPRGLAPLGWHIPAASEWRELIEFLGGEAIGGGKMKDTLSNLWIIVPPGSFNESGFSARPAGGRGLRGEIGEVGTFATWWSSTAQDATFV